MKAIEKSKIMLYKEINKKERENTNTNEDNVTSSRKEEIENLKKDFKYIKETLRPITQS